MNYRTPGAWLVVSATLALALLGGHDASAQVLARLEESVIAFDEIVGMRDGAIPEDLLGKAQCVAIVPGLKKGALMVGAKYGRGFVSCRREKGWSPPAGIIIEGGSFGFQIGGSETDVLLVIMNKRGVDRLLSSRFTLGADASVAAGPVGRSATAQTDAMMTAEILSWSRSRGVFAGIALSGATLRGDNDANRDLYRRRISVRDIVAGLEPVPEAAKPLIERFSKY